MGFLKNRGVAAAIAAVVMAASLLLGVRTSVNRQVNRVEAQFYDGVYLTEEGYTQKSIDSQLSARAEAALGLVSLASGTDVASAETQALRDARDALLDADGITAKWNANEALQKAFEALYPLLLQSGLPDNKAAALESYRSTMDGAQSVIRSSAYNSSVSEFERDILGKFPVNLLGSITGADTPEYFGVEG